MDLRGPETADTDRIRELVRSAMTTSYALSPQQLDTILEAQFCEDRLNRAFDSSERVVFVAENGAEVGEETILGFAEGALTDGRGELRWLFVDPEHRGGGTGTELFEALCDSFRERGVDDVLARTLEANREGSRFLERFGFEETDEREIEIGTESLVEAVYAQSPTGSEPTTDFAADDLSDADLPNAETHDGVTTATTEDGQQVYLDREDPESGTDGPFLLVYTDEEHTERFGYYCGNCGSLDTAVDDMDRIECGDCANTHASRSDEAYDDSYL